MKINDIILKSGNNDWYYTTLSEIDKFGYSPKKDKDGRFYFEVNVQGDLINFYQSGDYQNAFSDDLTESYVFSPDDKNYENIELHIISDYEK